MSAGGCGAGGKGGGLLPSPHRAAVAAGLQGRLLPLGGSEGPRGARPGPGAAGSSQRPGPGASRLN